jgi:hypothetical protein
MLVSVAAVTVSGILIVAAPRVAVTMVGPEATAVTSPPLLTVATALDAELHVTVPDKSLVLPSE